jgi:hypothetical protein
MPPAGAGSNDRTPQSSPVHGISHLHLPLVQMPFNEHLVLFVQGGAGLGGGGVGGSGGGVGGVGGTFIV